jgi:hypothetical protein
MLFNISFPADWNKIGSTGDVKHTSTLNVKFAHAMIETTKVGDKVLLRKDGILRKSERSDPWTIT